MDFYELTKKHIPALGDLRVTAKVENDAIVKILRVEYWLPGHASPDVDLTPFYSPSRAPEFYGWILAYHHEHGAGIRREQENDRRFDMGFNEHELAGA